MQSKHNEIEKPKRRPRNSPEPEPDPAPVAPIDCVTSMLHETATQTQDWKLAAADAIPDTMAGWLVPQYLLAIRNKLAALPDGPERLKLLRRTTSDTVALQRGNYWGSRLQLEYARLEFAQQKHRDLLAAATAKSTAAAAATTSRRDPKLPLSEADRLAIVDKIDTIMGLK